mmetsp:Transcript_1296/g.2569  ORF Transcript_1296/g.2569 Transcript_1296/m.2569 type:complete len:117 (-) Transcript_1296:285-635(-)|eukprot:CAMPEP_0181298966 /NCGR_PEP_ID=MMETSP1101-20121128/6075_1 /TAXON_ID=46948 /ORGANISM="Rhodomonas abbreviata, Strain Caron Lab Isolate" /LENGTH=116 /DNA_ID=CAMNT_0023404045 /DNA_START=97 /DNA_END=447 /DNA_ORIENTATION=-
MGKRKTAKKVMKKAQQKVMSKFDCPFCNHMGSIKVSINKKAKFGQCKCSVCSVQYATTVTALSEPIDIFCEWIDECEKANKGPSSDGAGSAQRPSRRRREGSDDDDDEDEEEEDED